MKTIYVYNNDTNSLESYRLNDNDYMPYNTNNTLKINEFAPGSNIIWTTSDTMKAYNKTKTLKPEIQISKAFNDLSDPRMYGEESHAGGTGFDFVIPNGTFQDYLDLFRVLKRDDIWSNVMDVEHTRDYLHVDEDYTYDSCEFTRYPLLKSGDSNTYVLVLQTGLIDLGYLTSNDLNGRYDNATMNAVKQFQFDVGLNNDGIMGCRSWLALVYNLTH